MSPSIWDLFSTADFRTIFLALISVGLSLAFAFPAAVSVFRWIVSRVRLQLILRKENLHACNTSDSKIDVSVSGLFVHPVKSMRSISLSESTLDRKGLTGDRRFMVVYELPLPVYKKNWGQGDTTHRFLTTLKDPSKETRDLRGEWAGHEVY